LLDLAPLIPAHALRRAIEQAERLQLFDLQAVDALIERSRRRPGVGALKDALTAYRDLPPVTRSELERRFLDSCRDAGLPSPAVNVWIADQEVDALWPDQRLVVELGGYRVLRVTRRRLDTDAAAVIGAIRSLLS
jgi:hypothetical protein